MLFSCDFHAISMPFSCYSDALGLGAGVIWTSQGSYFAHASELMSSDASEAKQFRAWLAGPELHSKAVKRLSQGS